MEKMQSGHIEQAVEDLKKASATNDVLAQFYIAQCYEYGIVLPEDKTQAFLQYRRVAERGFAPAMKELSRFYYYGIGVAMNLQRGQEWNQRYQRKNFSVQLPDLLSIYNSGLLLANNDETPTTEVTATSKNEGAKTQKPIASEAQLPVLKPVVAQESPSPSKHEQQKSYIDIDIPVASKKNELVFAFIFSNEDYQDVASVPNAINDGESMAKYCEIAFGLPPENIHLVKNATLNNMRREINLMKQIAEAYDNEATFLIYYAGQGIPDEKTQNAYLLPVDGFISDMTTCYSLKDLYDNVGSLPTKRNIIILDACFSGANRTDDMIASARGVAIKPKAARPSGNTIVMSSSQGAETSYSYNAEKHGLFTFYLLKKIKDSGANVTLQALYDYVKDNVSKKSIVINNKSQTPSISYSPEIADQWQQWSLK